MSFVKSWRVLKFGTGGFGLWKHDEFKTIVYHLDPRTKAPMRFDTHEEALAAGDRLNGKPTMPKVKSLDELRGLCDHVSMTEKMRSAIADILLAGKTWRQAAESHSVTESGILRAMRRVASANHP